MEASINAHMPGLIARVRVNQGDRVKKGEEVAVINCMKVELSVNSGHDGVVKDVLVNEWSEVQVGSPILILDVDEGENGL